jgi:hypothetical protein
MTEKSKIDFTPSQYLAILIAATIMGFVLRLAQYLMPGLELFLIGYGFSIVTAYRLYRGNNET